VSAKSPAIQKLIGFQNSNQPVPWVRLYRLPEFVFFSHRKHVDSGITCQACHGRVAKRDVLKKEKPTSMNACVDCHKKSKASVACNLCHELDQ
jgi:hypothetical protein